MSFQVLMKKGEDKYWVEFTQQRELPTGVIETGWRVKIIDFVTTELIEMVPPMAQAALDKLPTLVSQLIRQGYRDVEVR